MDKLFQSYLIIGTKGARRGKTKDIIKNFGFNLNLAHTDLFTISPVKDHISIDQIRALKGYIFQKPITGQYKLIIIEEAQKLTIEAQNSLLKILEEPPSHAIIILEATNKSTLLPTIISRITIIQAPQVPDKNSQTSSLLLNKNVSSLLVSLSEVEDPKDFLEGEILSLYNLMQERSIHQNNDDFALEEIASLIEKCAKVKEMIEANVNGKFALLSLAI